MFCILLESYEQWLFVGRPFRLARCRDATMRSDVSSSRITVILTEVGSRYTVYTEYVDYIDQFIS